MSRKEIISEFEQEQSERERAFDEEYKMHMLRGNAEKMMQYVAEVHQLDNNMTAILQEEMDYETPDGKKMTIVGEKNTYEEDGKTVKTYGQLDVFEGEPYGGKPFYEVSRNMFSHFKIFCLENGLTEQELIQMAQPNPPAETVEKVRSKKKDFFDMVTKFDNPNPEKSDREPVYNYFTKLSEMVIDKAPDILKLGNPDEGVESLHASALMFAGAGSYISQTLQIGDSKEPQATKDINAEVSRRMAEKGVHTDLGHVYAAVQPLEIVMDASHRLLDKGQFDPQRDISDRDAVLGNEKIGQAIENYIMAGMVTRANNNRSDVHEPAGKRLEKAEVNDDARVEFETMRINHDKEGLFRQAFPAGQEFKESVRFDYNSRAAENLYAEMAGNVRRNIFGRVKDNSQEYTDIMTGLDNFRRTSAAINNRLAEGGQVNMEDVGNLRRDLINLQKAARTYVQEKDPSSPEGIARYKMALRAARLAQQQAKDLNAIERRLKGYQKEEQKNAVHDEDLRQREQNFSARTEAIDNNQNMSAEAKELEHGISADLYAACMAMDRKGARKPDGSLSDSAVKELTGIMGSLSVKLAQRSVEANGKEPLTDQQLAKLAAQNIRNGVAESMARNLPEKMADVAKLTTSQLIGRMKDAAEKIKENRAEAEKVREQAEKAADRAEAKTRVRSAGKNWEAAAQLKEDMWNARNPESWGISQKDKMECGQAIMKNSRTFSVDRTMLSTLSLGLMLQSRNPSYSIEQIFSKDMAGERAKFGKMAVEMVKNDDVDGIAKAFYTEADIVGKYVSDGMKKIPELNITEFRKPENRMVSLVGQYLFDAHQEFSKAEHYVSGDPQKTGYEKQDADKVMQQIATFEVVRNEVDRTNITLDPGEKLGSNVLKGKLGKYVHASLMNKHINDLRKGREQENIWDIEGLDKFLTTQKDAINIHLGDKGGLLSQLNEFVKTKESRRAIFESMQDDTLAKDLKLDIKIGPDGQPKISFDIKNLQRKIDSRIAARQELSAPAQENKAPVKEQKTMAMKA